MNEKAPLPFLSRFWNTAVFWTWLFNGLRFASGLLLLPLLYRKLSAADLSMYGLFLNYSAFVFTFDTMFSVTIARNVGYAMRGVRSIQSLGIAEIAEDAAGPNTVLLGQLLAATQRIYRYLAAAILLLLGILGTLSLLHFFPQTSNPAVAWTAWAVTVVAGCLELYTGYWLVFLRGMNKVVLSARLSAGIYALKLALAISFLLAGFGLLAVALATLISGLLQRFVARRFTRVNLPPGTVIDSSRNRELIRNIWPNSWRLGLILFVLNAMIASFGVLISREWGLSTYYRYGISHQIFYTICMNMAAVWTYVKWPIVSQLRAANDLAGLRTVLWPRLWLQVVTYLALSIGLILAGPVLLERLAPEKELLPRAWLALLAAYAFLEMHYSFWTTLISTENRIPSMWASVITNLASVALAIALARFTSLGLGSFILAPLIAGLAFNYWYWPLAGARTLATTWTRFLAGQAPPRNHLRA